MTTTSYQPRVTAGMPLDLLVSKLERAGGADLTKRQRAALRGLALLLPHGSAAGKATAGQVGRVTGYSGRWMREGLADLEDLGLIEWHRGGVLAGVPQPSVFRVAKDALCDLIARGWAGLRAVWLRRQQEQRARVAGLTVRGRHKRRSAHAEVSSHLNPFGEGTGAASGLPGPPPASTESVRRHAEQARAVLAAATRQPSGR